MRDYENDNSECEKIERIYKMNRDYFFIQLYDNYLLLFFTGIFIIIFF